MHPAVIAAIVAGVILLLVIIAALARTSSASDEGMESMMDRDLPPEPLRLRDRERSADLD